MRRHGQARSWWRAAAASVGVAVLVGACGGGQDPTVGDVTATSTTSPSTSDGGSSSSSPGSTGATPTTAAIRTIELKLEGKTVVGGPRKETVAVGEKVRIVAVADVAEELHVHTYELKIDLRPGTPGEVVFDAAIPGRHEVEFEKAHKLALTLEVR